MLLLPQTTRAQTLNLTQSGGYSHALSTRRIRCLYTLALASVLLFAPQIILAATLSLSPSAVSVPEGGTFTIRVMVESTDQAMNAVSGSISFPPDLIRVDSISTSDSVLSLWVQQPAYSNQNGTITFGGVVPNPGYQGSRAQILSITFTALMPGSGVASFTSSAVLANDGNGTNIITNAAPAQISVTDAGVAVPPPAPHAGKATVQPVVPTTVASSSTREVHPGPVLFGISWCDLGWYVALTELVFLMLAFAALLFVHYDGHKQHSVRHRRRKRHTE